MPTTFTEADKTVAAVVKDAITKWHPDLREAKPTFNLLFAFNGEGEAALKKNGLKALAIIKVNNLEDRAKGLADVTIKIDGEAWEAMGEAGRLALIDHELEHLEVKREKAPEGEVGEIKHEAFQVDTVFRKYVQGFFPWG